MYKRIATLYDGSIEASRALCAALALTKTLAAELEVVVMKSRRPVLYAYAQAVARDAGQILDGDLEMLYDEWQEIARKEALTLGIEPAMHVFESNEQFNITEFLRLRQVDLLVLGLHQKGSLISRLWRTVYELAEDAPCGLLGVR